MSGLFEGYPQFINWKAVPKPKGRTDKVPVNSSGEEINHLNPANWLTEEQARATGLLVGFVFTEADPFFFVDIDHALINGEWSPLALSVLSAFPGCYVEVSQGGDGLHIFGVGGHTAHRSEEQGLGGFYTEKRFVALTGTSAQGATSVSGQRGVNWLVENYFKPRVNAVATEWTDSPSLEWCGPEDDEDLIKRAKRSKSAKSTFGDGASFFDLFNCNTEKLTGFYPATDGEGFDHSSVDAALASHLAFYTGKNCERMERIFNMSALGQRDKWVDRPDYRERTILGAVSICRSVYNRPPPPDPIGSAPLEAVRVGNQFLDLNGQLEYFRNFVYVISKHRIFTPCNGMLKPDQFRAVYGGYQFAIAYEGKPTKNAFEAFTESQLYNFPKAQGVCFRPEEPGGSILLEEGLSYLNTYYPVRVDRKRGDPSRFLELLSKIIIDERDRTILMSYMAACVQHVGCKFQWAPLLQGVQGNGKTFLATAVSKAIGEKYTHICSARDIASTFTGWVDEKLFVIVEELLVKGKEEAYEALQPLITNRRIEVHKKGVEKFTGDNRANFFLCTNPKDALLKLRNDRRVAPFYTAQQSPADILASGMGGGYFPNLYNWAREEGFAIITEYLHTFPIPPEFNPAGACHRAPVTTSTQEALSLSLGSIDQEVLEAIEEGRPGFRGGWISSVALDNLLSEKRRKIAHNKRKELLENLGYVQKGRMNSPSPLDGGKKPMLYVTGRGEISVRLMSLNPGTETAQAYTNAQGSSVPVYLGGNHVQ